MKKSISKSKDFFPIIGIIIALVILVVLLYIGYSMLSIPRVGPFCLNSVEKEMTKFKTNLEDTVSRKSTRQFDFNPQDECFSSKYTTMKIELERKKEVCAARCNFPSDQCYVMTYNNSNIADSFRQKCLDLPPLTNFLTKDCPIDGNYLGYLVIDPTNPDNNIINKGMYIFTNISPAGGTYPRICVYYKAN